MIGSVTSGAFLMLARDSWGIGYQHIRNGLTAQTITDKAVMHLIDHSSDRKRASMCVDLAQYQPIPEHV